LNQLIGEARVTIAVTDQGPGIPEKDILRLKKTLTRIRPVLVDKKNDGPSGLGLLFSNEVSIANCSVIK